jgi:hypothetical protein
MREMTFVDGGADSDFVSGNEGDDVVSGGNRR